MQIIGQSTKTISQQPYVHLGYVAASNMVVGGGISFGGICLIVIGIVQLFLRKRLFIATGIISIIIGILLFVGSLFVGFEGIEMVESSVGF